MVSILLLMGIYTEELGAMTRIMDAVFTFGRMVKCLPETMSPVSAKEKGTYCILADKLTDWCDVILRASFSFLSHLGMVV
jgi:hypothetical protein